MGTGCTKEPAVIDRTQNRKQISDLKIKLKLKVKEVESKIRDKNKEVEKYKESAKFQLKNGNKSEAKRFIKKKQFNQQISERLQNQVQVLDEQLMILENTEINQDITETITTVNAKIKQVTSNIDIRELEKAVEELEENRENQKIIGEEIGEALNQANEADPDISEELERLEAEMNPTPNLPSANKEKLVNDNVPTHKEPEGNLVFL